MPLEITEKLSVVVGVKPHSNPDDFIDKVQSFCGEQACHYHLVEALRDQAIFPSVYEDILGSFDLSELDRPAQASSMARALDKLEALKTSSAATFDISSHTLTSDDPAQALLSLAAATASRLIAIEVGRHLYEMIPSGISVALRLLAGSPVQVLILREGCPNLFKERDHTLLIADDFRDTTRSALMEGLRLAAAWGYSEVEHLHVLNPETHSMLQRMRFLHRAVDQGSSSVPEVFDYLRSQLKHRLEERATPYLTEFPERHCSYEASVAFGPIAHEIKRVLHKKPRHLAVFGRHQRSHTKPLGSGRVPFAAMLAQAPAVLVVP